MDFSLLLFIAFFAIILILAFTKLGKGLMFGGKILETHEREIVQTSGINKTKIRVHLIAKRSGEKCVGIEVADNAKLSFSFRPITLSQEEAKRLVTMLDETANET
ncbi:hypothetical protein [Ferrimonas balearica]|uniref:hypothetical protein n=1 Tax=Ferrimonas balearica TaxID=44012 RepID=UPI001C98FD68|nr:hypothetical protein [Ferrimonas balearica]MBY5991737.1 hypothetical protein [Ferrimonas balearica]